MCCSRRFVDFASPRFLFEVGVCDGDRGGRGASREKVSCLADKDIDIMNDWHYTGLVCGMSVDCVTLEME